MRSDEFSIEIEGIDEVCRLFEEAPRRAIPTALLRGLAAGGRVIEETMAGLAPDRTGELLADLATVVTLDSEMRGGVAAVGFSHGGSDLHGYGMDYVARFVEYGHRLVGHKPLKKELGQVAPHPFMRPAAESSAEAAMDELVAVMMEELTAAQLLDAESAAA